jgi:pyridoxine/pyridoxamine 5'-phosphate oxidase
MANKTGEREVTLALFRALYAESGFRNYANAKVPSSWQLQTMPWDATTTQWAYLQQRVKHDGSSRGWGNVQQAMDPEHAMGEFLKRAKRDRRRPVRGAHLVAPISAAKQVL